MLENVTRYVEEGEAPLDAALKGSREISFTIVSISISLIAVLIPLLLMGGIIGAVSHKIRDGREPQDRQGARKIARLRATQDAIDIGGGATKGVYRVGSVGKQTAGSGKVRYPQTAGTLFRAALAPP
jgi:hypothetical protein